MNRIYKVAWAIVADGTLFKGAYCVIADDEAHAIERTKEAMGQDSRPATFVVKDAGERAISLGKSEYPADGVQASMPHISGGVPMAQPARFVFDVAARANVIAVNEEDAIKKLGHAITGKDVPSVKYVRTKAVDPEPIEGMSPYERHLLERQFRSIRVAST